MKQNRFKFSRSVAYKWIISYAVIMLIPLIVSAIIYLQTKQIVEYEIERAGSAMLKQMQHTIDSEINQAEKMAMQLSVRSDVNKYLNMTPAQERESAYQIYQTRQELGRYKATNDFIDGVYLYSSRLDKVLTDETYAGSRMFFEMNQTMIGMPYEEWIGRVGGQNGTSAAGGVLPYTEFQRWENNVVLMRPFSSAGGENGLKGTLILPLNSSKIQSMLQNVDWVDNGDVYIVDKNNQILFHNSSVTSPGSLPYAGAVEAGKDSHDGTSFLNIAGTENMVSFIDSGATDWRYISVFPSSVFWDKAREIRKLNLLGLLLCCLLGGGVISYFARKNYNPVRELVNMFAPSPDGGARRMLDEFSFIRESALATIRERDDSNSREQRQLRVLQSYYLSRLLKGQSEGGLSTGEAARLHHFDWLSDEFAVLLFFIQGGGEGGPSPDLSNFIVSNIIGDFTGEHHRLSFTEMDGMLAAVVNIAPERSGCWKEDIEGALVQTLEFIGSKYSLQIVMAGSERHVGLGALHQGYIQALEAQEYRLVLEESISIWYGDIEPQQSGDYLSLNDEAIFINLIRSGEFEQASAMVEAVLAQLFSAQAPMEMVRYALIDLTSSIMKAVPREAKQPLQWEEWRPMKRIHACSTRSEFRQELTELTRMACAKAGEQLTMMSGSGIGEQVTAFVQEHFTDLNLSVSMIGGHFGITPQYLSRLFKEQTGQGLHDYISRVRTSAAKPLLQKDVSIEEISSRVGFSSSSAFIRVFKKYEGVTPGRFKSLV